MTLFFWGAGLLLLLNMVAGLVFVGRSRGGGDALLAALLLGTTGVATLLVLAFALPMARALDVALVLALLAAILGVTFALRGWPGGGKER